MYSYAVRPTGKRRQTCHALVRLRMTAASVAACFDLFAPMLETVPLSPYNLDILVKLPAARNGLHQGVVGSGSCRDRPPRNP